MCVCGGCKTQKSCDPIRTTPTPKKLVGWLCVCARRRSLATVVLWLPNCALDSLDIQTVTTKRTYTHRDIITRYQLVRFIVKGSKERKRCAVTFFWEFGWETPCDPTIFSVNHATTRTTTHTTTISSSRVKSERERRKGKRSRSSKTTTTTSPAHPNVVLHGAAAERG